MRITARIASFAIVMAVALGACAGSSSSDGSKGHRSPATTTVLGTTARVPATTTSPLDRYNPEHDPTKCVQVLPNGQIMYVEILLVPGVPAPADVNGAKCG
jgi:hypothetical protein